MKPHKHAELIKAWADGAAIEVKGEFTDYQWRTFQADYVPSWSAKNEYRIKPEPKPDIEVYVAFSDTDFLMMSQGEKWPRGGGKFYYETEKSNGDHLKITFDGKTGKLKDAEVLK